MNPQSSRRESNKSPQESSGRIKVSPIIQKLYREPSPTGGKTTLMNHALNSSPSPNRKLDPAKTEESQLVKEFQYYKTQEKKLSEAIQTLKQECMTMKTKIFKQENEIKLKSAKLENEKNQIIDLFVDCVGKKTVFISLGNDRSKSVHDDQNKRFNDLSCRSNSFQVDLQKNEMEVNRLNKAYKIKLRKATEVLPASVRALARYWNFEK